MKKQYGEDAYYNKEQRMKNYPLFIFSDNICPSNK